MKAYSLDLRRRMFSYSLTHSVRETATVFHVSPNTVHLLQKRFAETGQLAPRPKGGARPRLISAEGELFLAALLGVEPDLTLEELRHRYTEAYGVSVSLGTMFNTLQRLEITLKKSPATTPRKTPRPSKPKRNAITGKSTASLSKTGSTSMKPEPA